MKITKDVSIWIPGRGKWITRARAWCVTLSIKYREPELWKQLCEPLDEEDFGEVPEP